MASQPVFISVERPVLRVEQSPRPGKGEGVITAALLLLAGLNCTFQILWFWRFASHNTNYDAVSYIGIARHLAAGDIRGSLHGYWSPLISWLMAAFSIFSSNYTLIGRALAIASFLACLPLLYLLTLKLWNSSALAALAVLWFTTARGIAAFSVYFIGADFLLSGLVLIYFFLLLGCLRQPSRRKWLLLGVPHAAAFLAKAIAMPWLAIATIAASLLSGRQSLKRSFGYLCAGMVIPLLVWSGWGMALKAKYGQFTPGYQSRWNLLETESRSRLERQSGNLSLLTDTSQTYDRYMVVDNMYPGSPLWQARLDFTKRSALAVRKIFLNFPSALKELIILITPGGVLAVLLAVFISRRKFAAPETQLLWIVCLCSVVLILAYSLLVFDGARYLLPLAPILIACAVPFLWPAKWRGLNVNMPSPPARWRWAACTLFVAGTLFSQFYWASPFRTIRRDYQLSCYDAAEKLRELPSCKRLVVMGSGPFPEHGVGWEAGIYSSYFAGCHMVAFADQIPAKAQLGTMQADLKRIGPDAVLLFGNPQSSAFAGIQDTELQKGFSSTAILDPQVGEVGTLFWKQP